MQKILRADHKHLKELIPLFDAYRVFYGQLSDTVAAESFLTKRLKNQESVIFMIYEKKLAVGFVQLYKTFSSVSLEPFFILNDLYVAAEYRGKGLGAALLQRAKAYCTELNYKGLALETATDNPAQKLYEKLGWKNDTDVLHYFWTRP